MKVAICDDEKPWAIEVNSLLNEYSRNRHIDIFSFFYESGTALIESEKNFDIIFMDYQMNELPLAETLGLIFWGTRYNFIIAHQLMRLCRWGFDWKSG